MMKDFRSAPPTIREPGAGHQVGQGAPAQAVQEEALGRREGAVQSRRVAVTPSSIAPGCTGPSDTPAAGGENTSSLKQQGLALGLHF